MVNSPVHLETALGRAREKLLHMARGPLRRQEEIALDTLRIRNQEYQRTHWHLPHYQPGEEPAPAYHQVAEEFAGKRLAIKDPTTLIMIDEADRLRMPTLEQARALFDQGEHWGEHEAEQHGAFGLILIGMPGIEKRMARYPQFYSRIGFVHEFGPLGPAEMRRLLEARSTPSDPQVPGLTEEAIAAAMRITGGNFRLLHRLLTEAERVLRLNGLSIVSKEVIETARESLVIGEA